MPWRSTATAPALASASLDGRDGAAPSISSGSGGRPNATTMASASAAVDAGYPVTCRQARRCGVSQPATTGALSPTSGTRLAWPSGHRSRAVRRVLQFADSIVSLAFGNAWGFRGKRMVKSRLRFGILGLAGVAVVVLAAGAALGVRQLAPAGGASQSATAAAGGPLVPRAVSSAAPDAVLKPVTAPARLSVPVLGVDADVEAVGVDPQGRMGTPSRPEHVGWYRQGAGPGQPGNTVVGGHLDRGNRPGAFLHLPKPPLGPQA